MATQANATAEEFLKCPICLEFYINPKYLPCLHTFCGSCLQSYISSSLKGKISETKTKVEFTCPVCRTTVTGLYPEDGRIEELVSLFPKNQTIVSLLDKHKLQSNIKYCDPCLAEKVEISAETWCKLCNEAFCKDCSKYHRKMPILKCHKLFKLSDMDLNDLNITRLDVCDIHRDEVLKAFCKDHDKACCVTCITIEHRKCDEVTPLEIAAEGIKEKPETQELLKHLRESENAVSEMLRITKQNVGDLETRKETMLAEVATFRKLVDKHFNDLEIKLKEEISSIQKKSLLEANDYIADLESKYAAIVNYRKLLETCLQKASDVHILLEMKKLINTTKILGKEVRKCACEMKEISHVLILEPKIKEALSISNLGMVEVKTKAPFIKMDFLHSKFFGKSGVREISTLSFSKQIQSATFLQNGTIALAMYYVLVFCDEKGGKIGEISVDGTAELNGVTVLSSGEILLAWSSGSVAYSVNANSLKLKNWKNFTCHNIVNTGESIIAACKTGIKVFDYEGQEKQNIPVRGKNVCNIAFHGGTIYYTVSDEHLVRAISMQGVDGFEYKNENLTDPRGIDTDAEGVIYVAGYASSNVHQISKYGHLINIILTEENGIVNPNVVCLNKTGNRLLVSHSGSKANIYEV